MSRLDGGHGGCDEKEEKRGSRRFRSLGVPRKRSRIKKRKRKKKEVQGGTITVRRLMRNCLKEKERTFISKFLLSIFNANSTRLLGITCKTGKRESIMQEKE